MGLGSAHPSSQEAELVALRVPEHVPRLVALADVGVDGAQGAQPEQLLRLIASGGVHVEVDPVLARLRLGDRDEDEGGLGAVRRANLDAGVIGLDRRPPEHFRPPRREFGWVVGVDHYLGQDRSHPPIVAERGRATLPAPVTMRLRPLHAVLAVVIAVVLLAGIRGAVTVHQERSERLDPSMAAVIEDLKAFVSSVRGLPFLEPVDVAVLDNGAFRRSLSGGEPTEESDADVAVGVLRALGLLEGAGDIGPAGDLDADTVAGFYDTETRELVVRGPQLTPFVRQVLVHELTHALDDQHFDLEPDLVDDEAALAFEALVEGNAVVVESRYLASVSPDEREAARAEEDATFGGSGGGVPDIVAELGAFPYRDGPRLVGALLDAGGQARLDAAFDEPPTTTAEVLHPRRFLDNPGRARVGPVAAEGRVVDGGVLGELILRLMLVQSMPSERASRAAAGWAGDRYVAWTAGPRTCVRATVVLDSPAEATELATGLRQWAGEHAGAAIDPLAARATSVTLTRCA